MSQNTPSLTRTIASYVHDVRLEDIPARVKEPIVASIADAIGCGVIGSTSREVIILSDYFHAMGSSPTAVIWGTNRKACAPWAASINAAAVHAWDFDDTVMPGIVHPAGVMVSTALALAEQNGRPIDGRAFLAAVIAGYEVANIMSAALGGREWRVYGFYNTVPVIFGAAATAAKISGLNLDQVVAALGIAATQASGLYSATMTKRLNAPKAVEGGIYAAELAQRGFEAPIDGIGDGQGFLKTFSRDPKWDLIPREIGKYAFEVYHKAYPCIRSNQPAIYAARLLQDSHPVDATPANIKTITVHADRLTKLYTVETPGGGTSVQTIGNALVSLPFCIAAMLVDGELTLAQFTREKVSDPRIQALLRKVEIEVDPSIDLLPPTQRYRATVEVELNDGRVLKQFCPAPKGDPTNRLTRGEMLEKFLGNTTTKLDRATMASLYEILESIEDLQDVREIAAKLQVP